MEYHKRHADVFVTHSDRDSVLVTELVDWLGDAGLRVIRHARSAAEDDGTTPAGGVMSARASIVCASHHWSSSPSFRIELDAALAERALDPRYRVVILSLDDSTEMSDIGPAHFIHMHGLEPERLEELLQALLPEPMSPTHPDRDVYMSRSWHASESLAGDVVCELLHADGYRLIGDSMDHNAFDPERRIAGIVETCGALVAVLPRRDAPAPGNTSAFILDEVRIAMRLGVPYLLFADEGIVIPYDDLRRGAIGGRVFSAPIAGDDSEARRALELFDEEFRPPRRRAFAFIAGSTRNDLHGTDALVQLMERVSGLQCIVGQRLQSQHAQAEIIDRIRDAQFVLADVSAGHLNSLIEAGIARGASTPLHLICATPESGDLTTRFMLRDMEVNWYKNRADRLAAAHRIARLYRRRVFAVGSASA